MGPLRYPVGPFKHYNLSNVIVEVSCVNVTASYAAWIVE